MLTAWEACLCKWGWQTRGVALQPGGDQEEWEEQPSPKYPPGEAPHAGRKLQSCAGKRNSGPQHIGYSLSSGLDGCCQPPARSMGTGVPPWAVILLLPPFAVLLSRLCPAHHHPQGTNLGVPYLQRVSPWFANPQHWPRAPKKSQPRPGNQVK